MGKMASDSMIMRVFEGICSIDPGVPVPPGGGVSREQLVIFLADALRGTAEERAPLVMAMAYGNRATVMTDQIREVSMIMGLSFKTLPKDPILSYFLYVGLTCLTASTDFLGGFLRICGGIWESCVL